VELAPPEPPTAVVAVAAPPTTAKEVMVDCWPLGRRVVSTTSWLTSPPPGVYVSTTVLPWASVVVMSWPERVPDRTTELPYWSVVVTADSEPALAAADDAPAAAAEVTMWPPEATSTLASGEAEVTVWPCALVPVTTAAGATVEVVNVLPAEFVVAIATVTLVEAELWNAEVVCTTVLPAELVDDTATGTITPVCVPALEVVPDTVPLLIAAGVLVTVLPAALVVVTGDGVLAASVEEATAVETVVLPAELVVVRETVDAPIDDEPLCAKVSVEDTIEPSEAVERTTEVVTDVLLAAEEGLEAAADVAEDPVDWPLAVLAVVAPVVV
jgi:hypothetical protein